MSTLSEEIKEDSGSFVTIGVRNQEMNVDNNRGIPFRPVLLRLLDAPVDVDACNYVKALKYITKYIAKGSDQSVFGVHNENDEVNRYQMGMIVSHSQAVW